MNEDLVSIVIPVYNSEKFLEKSIKSALEQTYKKIEIIVIDDGSTDSSSNILKRHEKEIIIIHQEKQGLANAVNHAIKKMKGKWLKWLSPDDLLKTDAVEILVNSAKSLPENTILYSNWELIDNKDELQKNFSESNYNKFDNFDYNVRLIDGQQININTSLIPRVLFNKGCIFRQLSDPVAIDYDFFLRAALLYDTKFFLVEKSLLRYRIHEGQLSHKNITSTLSFLSKLKTEVLSMLDHEKQRMYDDAVTKYNKTKPPSKKTMELGLKISTQIFPEWLTDRLLVFYVNKLRRTRS